MPAGTLSDMRHAIVFAVIPFAMATGCASKPNDRSDGAERRTPAAAAAPGGNRPVRPVSVTGTEWYLLRLADDAKLTAQPQSRPWFRLDPGDNRRITGSTGVNVLNGTYELSGGALQFGPVSTTRRAAGSELMAREAAFLAVLKNTATTEIHGDTLTLRDAGGVTLAELRPLDAMR